MRRIPLRPKPHRDESCACSMCSCVHGTQDSPGHRAGAHPMFWEEVWPWTVWSVIHWLKWTRQWSWPSIHQTSAVYAGMCFILQMIKKRVGRKDSDFAGRAHGHPGAPVWGSLTVSVSAQVVSRDSQRRVRRTGSLSFEHEKIRSHRCFLL